MNLSGSEKTWFSTRKRDVGRRRRNRLGVRGRVWLRDEKRERERANRMLEDGQQALWWPAKACNCAMGSAMLTVQMGEMGSIVNGNGFC